MPAQLVVVSRLKQRPLDVRDYRLSFTAIPIYNWEADRPPCSKLLSARVQTECY